MKRRAIFRFFDRYLGIPILILIATFLKRKKRLPIENIRKILVIKLAALGDSILMIPMLRTLKNSFPDSEITFVCSYINEEIVRKIPFVDKMIDCNVHSFLKNPIGFFKFISKIRQNDYDIVIDAGQWERINSIITAFVKNNCSIGFKTEKQYKHFIYDRVVIHEDNIHELENFLSLLTPLGVNINENDKKLEYFLSNENRKFADRFWKENDLENRSVICFHPGCGENGRPREWSENNYIELGKRLLDYNESICLLITGSPREVEKCNNIASGIKKNIINVAGRFLLDDVVALVEKVILIVCSNTGMLHIASCVGTKTMGLHGPTNPTKWGAYVKNSVLIQSDKVCSPCLSLGHEYGCKIWPCMGHISVDDVFIHIRKVLNPELFQDIVKF